jgi:hypothetical protein
LPKRAFRSNLFCRLAAKKDFRCNPGWLHGRQTGLRENRPAGFARFAWFYSEGGVQYPALQGG